MITLLVFFAVFSCLLALLFLVTALWDSPAAGLKRRLKRLENNEQNAVTEDVAGPVLREVPPLEQVIFQLPLLREIKKLIVHSGTSIKPPLFVMSISIVSTSVLGVGYLLIGDILVALMVMSVVAYLPFIYLGYCKKRRQIKFAEQLPDALTMIARSLRAGHSLAAAVELISQELPQPAGGLFKTAYEQQLLGVRIAESLVAMSEKIESIDLHFFLTIVRINSESGGNMAEILEKLAETIKSRLQIRRQVQTYTAEGRMSGYVLLVLPVVVFIAFYLKNPSYMEVFFTATVCQLSLAAAVLAQIAGFFIIRKIVDIRI